MKTAKIIPYILALAACTAQASVPLEGRWSGRLDAGKAALRLVLNVTDSGDGKADVTLDSPDQAVSGIQCFVKYLSDDSIRVTMPKIAASYAAAVRDGRLEGTYRQGNFSAPLVLQCGAASAERPQTPRPPFGYTTREVKFANRAADAVLAGTLTIPANADASTPVVLMVTGSGLQNRDEELFGHKPFAVIADRFARSGIATLRYDDRGFGESTGNPLNAKTTDFAQDAATGIEYLRNMGAFGSVGVLGHSEGATVAFILGAGNSVSRPDFILALGAQSVRGDSILANQSRVALKENGVADEAGDRYETALLHYYDILHSKGESAAAASIGELTATWPSEPVYAVLKRNLETIAGNMTPWLKEFAHLSPAPIIRASHIPAMILYGELDTQVSPRLNEAPMRALQPGADIRLYPSLNHLFQHAVTGSVSEYPRIDETISEQVMEDMIGFVKKVAKNN